MFQTAINKGPEGEAINMHKSFMYQYELNGRTFPQATSASAKKKSSDLNNPDLVNIKRKSGKKKSIQGGDYLGPKSERDINIQDEDELRPTRPKVKSQSATIAGEVWHPGFAWAMTRRAFDGIGGLIDFSVLGSADYQMARCFIGHGRTSLPKKAHKSYHKAVSEYQRRCDEYIKGDVGVVNGTIIHDWHGSMKNRRYVERWAVLTENKFNPLKDIKRDWQGLYQLNCPDKVGLRDGIRRYFNERNEDGIDK
jgi:hypothetical protein